jgi:hypothetical protein
VPKNRPRATRGEVEASIREIIAYHRQGRKSLRHLPGPHRRAIAQEAGAVSWSVTKVLKARKFARQHSKE